MHQQDSTTTSSLPPNSFVWFWCGFLKIGLTPYPFDFRISHEISHPAIVFQFDLETSVETDRWRLLPRRSWFSRTVHFPSHTRRRREVPAEDTLIAMENDEKMMIDQWKPKESNGIQWNPMRFGMIWGTPPIFRDIYDGPLKWWALIDWTGASWVAKNERHCDAFFELEVFSEIQISNFLCNPKLLLSSWLSSFSPHLSTYFWFSRKKQKRLLRVAPTARYSVVDLEVYCTCCTPDVSLFFVFFILFPFISYVPCAAESIVHLDESPVELKNIQGYFAAEHSLSLGVWTSQLAWWTNRMEMWVKTARFWGLSKCHVQTRWITYLIYVKSSQKRPSSGVTCRPTRAKNLRLGHRKADFLL